MIKQNYYKIGGHCFAVEAEESLLDEMKDYEPFLVEKPKQLVFAITINTASHLEFEYTEQTKNIVNGVTSINGVNEKGNDIYIYYWKEKNMFWLECDKHYQKGVLTITGVQKKIALDFALTIMYRYSTLKLKTAAIHASTVSYKGVAYLFLGISGTGKSTHSRLWLKHFEGTELINDDKPIIRIMDNGEVRVYGSPWSGKTQCYRNVDYPVGAMVKLNQAPHNKIRRLGKVEAYCYLLQSIYGKRWNENVSTPLHQLEEKLVELVPMWHLECLPDLEAAELCKETIVADD